MSMRTIIMKGLLLALAFSPAVVVQGQEEETVQEEAALSPDQAYLRENAEKEGVIVRRSGLQIEILERGDGPFPAPTDMVIVHYEGKLIDGTVFDSSIARGRPARFQVTDVIRGWQEAMMLMTVGSKWRLTIPADIGYGDTGAQDTIPPGATLIFEVELLGIAE